MRHRLFIPAATALLFALAACTQDDLGGSTLPEGEYPLVINATGLQAVATPASTRATVDGDWQGVQTVALKMGDAVKEYTVTATDADGYKSATLSRTDDPHYWTSRDPITVSAWWPIDKADITRMPAVKVAEDQSTLAAFQGSDFISAIDRTVDGMSAQRKRVYVMSRKENLTNDEIAERLGISKRTVENHLSAVLATLRKLIVNAVILFW